MQDRQEAIQHEDLVHTHDGVAFDCPACEDLVHLDATETVCYTCGTEWTIEVTRADD